MGSIKHRFEYNVSPAEVFSSLISGEEIAKWWTLSATLKPETGSIGKFHWPAHGWSVEVRLVNFEENSYVEWHCVESNMQDTDAWEGTVIKFVIQGEGNRSQLDFSQEGYKDSPCHQVCDDGWRFVLGKSLKDLLENGKGYPYHDGSN